MSRNSIDLLVIVSDVFGKTYTTVAALLFGKRRPSTNYSECIKHRTVPWVDTRRTSWPGVRLGQVQEAGLWLHWDEARGRHPEAPDRGLQRRRNGVPQYFLQDLHSDHVTQTALLRIRHLRCLMWWCLRLCVSHEAVPPGGARKFVEYERVKGAREGLKLCFPHEAAVSSGACWLVMR